MNTKLQFYHDIVAILGKGNVVIGGSMSLLAHKDPSIKPDYIPGDIDLCVSNEHFMQVIDKYLLSLGYTKTIDIPNPYGFTVRAQYKLGIEKHDFFINPALSVLSSEIDGIYYGHPSVSWCARGFYAGMGRSTKAMQQLVDAGYITNPVVNKTSFKTRVLILCSAIKQLLYL